MNVIQFNTKQIRTASSFDELEDWQLLKIAPLLLDTELKKVRALARAERQKRRKKRNPGIISLVNSEFYSIRLQMLFILMRLRWNIPLQLWLWRNVDISHYVAIMNDQESKVVDWLFTAGLTAQRFPSVRVGLKKFIGPRESFRNLTYLEYTFAHSRYVAWLDNPTRENLQLFFAVLYRPERKDYPKGHLKYNADPRMPFDSVATDEHASNFDRLDERVMLVAVLWWQGCSEAKRKKYRHVYTGGKAEDPLTPKQVIIKLAGSAKQQDIDGICNSLYDNVMEDLDMNNKEAADRKREQKTKRRRA